MTLDLKIKIYIKKTDKDKHFKDLYYQISLILPPGLTIEVYFIYR